MSIPEEAFDAAAKAIHATTTREPKWALTSDVYKRFYRTEARAAIEAAMPAIREALARETAADVARAYDRGFADAAERAWEAKP
jgi:hypothetical protein